MTAKTHNAENERTKRGYLSWLRDARGQSEATLDAVASALHRFESHGRFRSFKTFRREQAISFKNWLAEQHNGRTGERLSKATLYATLKALRAFFEWLSREPGFRSHVNFSDAAYFNLTANDVRIAKAEREARWPTLEQIKTVLQSMPSSSVLERRDRALIAFTLLTGARDGALASFRLKHVDLPRSRVFHDPRQVRSKRAKAFTTYFFPVGPDVRAVIDGWLHELIEEHGFGPEDPLFPATAMAADESGLLTPSGLSRNIWSNASPIRAAFRRAFESAGLPYFNPHSFRKTLVHLGETRCRSPEAFKAWSQNLGHEGVLTTFSSYGVVSGERQAAIIASLDEPEAMSIDPMALENLKAAVRALGG